ASGRAGHERVPAGAQRPAAAPEAAKVSFGLTESRLVRQPSRQCRPEASAFLPEERDVTAVFGFVAFELRQQRRGSPAFRGEKAHEDLVAQRRRPSGSAREPGCERPLAARGEPKETSDAGAEWL